MKRSVKIPRIIKVEKLLGFKIWVMFNNGQIRLLDFQKIFSSWRVTDCDIEFPLLTESEFQKLELQNQTLSWPNIPIKTIDETGNPSILPYEIGPDVLYALSEATDEFANPPYGDIIKTARLSAGLTQDELAQRSGTTRFYISRIENGKTDFEISTLRKIVEAGLGKKLKLLIE
jgi:DNA-binding XRE family transcriptional regulator